MHIWVNDDWDLKYNERAYGCVDMPVIDAQFVCVLL